MRLWPFLAVNTSRGGHFKLWILQAADTSSCGSCGHFKLWALQAVVCLLVGCLTSQQHASVSQGRICTGNFTCCHTEIEAADQTFHLT